jgi:hypothetical protein
LVLAIDLSDDSDRLRACILLLIVSSIHGNLLLAID